ncbi:MAG: hypothetical protein IT160_03350 [Bryobacterales bacterium]|nr:hypothetical protein [Bryobacterales bacterium]
MSCCDELARLMDRDFARNTQVYQLTDGRILNEIDTEYFLVFGGERRWFAGINYCPFCGRAISRGLWNQEMEK